MSLVSLRGLLVLFAVGASLALWQPSAQARACTCDGDQAMAEQIDEADAVFTGTYLRDAEPTLTPDGGEPAEAALRRMSVEVEQVRKGKVTPLVTVVTPRDAAECGLQRMERGTRYLWFVAEDDEVLTADLCGGTKKATPPVREELAGLLGDWYAPAALDPPEERRRAAAPSSEETPGWVMATVGGLFLLAGGATYWLLKRHRAEVDERTAAEDAAARGDVS
ncbi:hypothetical protein [Nocardioides speluncae]|uniref:hypothetical protein n=1 Tax=Nocardioides speluncae TaxID=2670337 RepID=UPI0012B17907|nr:hypothetical protein [Nocardioides speluncae]